MFHHLPWEDDKKGKNFQNTHFSLFKVNWTLEQITGIQRRSLKKGIYRRGFIIFFSFFFQRKRRGKKNLGLGREKRPLSYECALRRGIYDTASPRPVGHPTLYRQKQMTSGLPQAVWPVCARATRREEAKVLPASCRPALLIRNKKIN